MIIVRIRFRMWSFACLLGTRIGFGSFGALCLPFNGRVVACEGDEEEREEEEEEEAASQVCWALSAGTEYALYYSDAVIAEAGPAGTYLMYNTVYSR